MPHAKMACQSVIASQGWSVQSQTRIISTNKLLIRCLGCKIACFIPTAAAAAAAKPQTSNGLSESISAMSIIAKCQREYVLYIGRQAQNKSKASPTTHQVYLLRGSQHCTDKKAMLLRGGSMDIGQTLLIIMYREVCSATKSCMAACLHDQMQDATRLWQCILGSRGLLSLALLAGPGHGAQWHNSLQHQTAL